MLNQPYPYYHKGKERLKIAGLLLVIGLFFEYLLVPFPRAPEEHLYSYEIITLFHIGVAVTSYLLYFLLLGIFIREDDWKVSKELLAILGLLILVGIGEWGIRPLIYKNGGYLSVYSLWEEIWHAILAGGMVYLLVTLVNVNLLTKKNDDSVKSIRLPRTEKHRKTIAIKANNLSDHFQLDPSAFICARAEGNYVEIFLKADEGVVRQIKRISLHSLDEQLLEIHQIIKTHRTYLVNVDFITGVKGNAQGYRLRLENIDFAIPVSRKHLNEFNRLVKDAES